MNLNITYLLEKAPNCINWLIYITIAIFCVWIIVKYTLKTYDVIKRKITIFMHRKDKFVKTDDTW